MRVKSLLALLALAFGTAQAASVSIDKTVSGFASPESVVVAGDDVFVSNVGAKLEPMARDGDGFVSRLDRQGGIKALKWAAQLNAPKGLIAVDGVNISCTAEPNADACSTEENDVCGTIAGACGLLGILGGVLDVDSDGDGVNDSLSVVIGLEMDATVISGPAE